MYLPGGKKGQSVVEFALVLPFFLLIVMGVIYFGMYFSDYVALNNIARSAAREASLLEETDYGTIRTRYADDAVSAGASDVSTYYLPNSAYSWNPNDTQQFAISKDSDVVTVTLVAPVHEDSGPLHALSGIMGDDSFLNAIKVVYEMHTDK